MNRLSALEVKRAAAKGLYADGAGLYLQVSATGSKSWVYRYKLNKRPRMVGLGSSTVVSLADARAKAAEYRRLVASGVDVLDHREETEKAELLRRSQQITFADCAERYVVAHEGDWANAKHRQQWRSTLATYAAPIAGELPVGAVDTGVVVRILEQIWKTKRETASRLRGRIEAVLDWATVRGYRHGENPARWKGHLDHLLPSRRTDAGHHAALPYAETPAFLTALSACTGLGAIALRLTILTACRTSEVLGASWPEFDLKAGVWTIPAARMKMKREHRVPLSRQAMSLLKQLHGARLTDTGPVFGLSNMAMLMVLRQMDRADLTVHGFRSTFKDWATEQTDYGRDVSEMALAHAIGDKVEAAYRRGELFDKRRKLMQDWADYCFGVAPTTSKD